MKYPTARKLRSGSWYCRVRVHGKDISITRRTEKEAIAEAMAIKAGIKLDEAQASVRRRSKTVSQAVDDYIAARENVLSPSTIQGYRIIQRTRFREAMSLKIFEVTREKWQRIVNAEAKLCSAKTLKNSWAFLSSVIYETTESRPSIRLPQIIEREKPFLTAEQIPVFLEAIYGTDIEIPALLGLSSLRRSEIFALGRENMDLQHKRIAVLGAAVVGPGGKLVRKEENKNKSSRRIVPIFPPLEAALKRTPLSPGLVVRMAPGTLYRKINRLCKEHGLPEVGIHGLRRSFASLAYHLGLSEEVTMRIGGWSDIYTMRKIYTRISALDIAKQSDKMWDFYAKIQPLENENGNENGDD